MPRPQELSQEIVDAAKAYLNGGWEIAGDVAPSVVGLCCEIKRGKTTVYQWRAKDTEEYSQELKEIYAEFKDTLADIDAEQQRILQNKGLTGDFNSTITKLMLSNHGVVERSELSGPDGGPIKTDNKWQVEFVNASPKG